jgi:hypothetical protein
VPRSDPTNENRPKSLDRPSGNGRVGLAVALSLVTLAGVVAIAVSMDDPLAIFDAESTVEDARPTGAGSVPEGEAGLYNDALTNGADDSQFIEPGAPTEATPAPLLEAPDVSETRVAPNEGQQGQQTPDDN